MMPLARFLSASFPSLRATAAVLAAAVLVGGCLQDDVTPVAPRYRAAVEGRVRPVPRGRRPRERQRPRRCAVEAGVRLREPGGPDPVRSGEPWLDPQHHQVVHGHGHPAARARPGAAAGRHARPVHPGHSQRRQDHAGGPGRHAERHRGLLGAAGVPAGVRREPRADVHRGRTGRLCDPRVPGVRAGCRVPVQQHQHGPARDGDRERHGTAARQRPAVPRSSRRSA